MMATELVSILVRLHKPDSRFVAASELAHLTRSKNVLLFDKDPEYGIFQISPGFPVVALNAQWATFLDNCATNGIAMAALTDPYTNESLQVFSLSDIEGKFVLSFLGGKPNEASQAELQQLLPFLASKLADERLLLNLCPTPLGEDRTEIDTTDNLNLYERTERELIYRRDIENKLRAADRRKDEFIANISHELRTPLNAILGWAELLRAQTLNHPPLMKSVDAIIRNAKTQASLLNDLLDTSSIVTGKVILQNEALDLTEVLERARETIEPLAQQKNIQLTYSYDVKNLLTGDAARLRQVFWNLFCNAVKFTPENGRILIHAHSNGALAIISITDSGMGIEKEFLPYVFDRFRQSDTSMRGHYGGLGLGLSIAKQFIDMHGGCISVASEGIGKGTTFTVKLPHHHSMLLSERYIETEELSRDRKLRIPPQAYWQLNEGSGAGSALKN